VSLSTALIMAIFSGCLSFKAYIPGLSMGSIKSDLIGVLKPTGKSIFFLPPGLIDKSRYALIFG